MNKLVIETQYMENYGNMENAYMKFKGGSTYVMFNCGDLTENEIATIVARIRPYITTNLIESNGGSEEYILSQGVMDHKDAHCADYETAIQFSFGPSGQVNFLKVTDNREDGWMKKSILEKTETWTGDMSTTKRANYKCEYLMENGDFVLEKDMKEWFDKNDPEPEVVLPEAV